MATPSFSHGPLHPPSTQTKPVRLSALPVHTTDQLAFSWHVIQPLPHIYTFTLIYTLSRSQMHAYMCTHTFQYNHKITKKLERKKPWECHNFSILFFQMFSAKPRNMDYFVFLKMKNPFIPAPKYLMYIRNFS